MNRAYRFVIDSDGTIIGTPDKTLRGFSDNVEEIVVISPFDSSYVGSFGVGTFNKPSISQYLSVSSDVVSDWVEADETFGSLGYQDIADWTVRRIALKRTTKLYISSKRGGSVFFSFKFGTIGLNDKTITYKGTFGRDHLLPTSLQVTGDYYTCEDIHYTQTVDTKNNVPLVFGYGMHVYWGSGGYWVKVSENMVLNTVSYEQAVDPSFAVNDEVVEDEINYLLSFESVLYDHEARIDQAELDIAAIEQDIVDMKNGTDEFNNISFKDGLVQGDVAKVRSMYYDSYEDLPRLLNDDDTDLLIGGELQKKIYNADGNVSEGIIVYINGSQGQRATADLYDISTAEAHGGSPAIITQPSGILSGALGKITYFGEITLPLSTFEVTGFAYAEGQPLFVSINSKVTNVAPTRPHLHVRVGILERITGPNAKLFLDFVVIPHLDHLSDVDSTGLIQDDNLKYNSNGVFTRDNRATNLVTANMVKSVTRTGTDLLTLTKYDNTTLAVVTLAELKTFIGEATNLLSGLMSSSDKSHLDALYQLLNDTTDGGADSLVDTIEDVLAIFQAYPEGADLVTALAGKVDKTTTIAGVDLADNITKEELKIALDIDDAESRLDTAENDIDYLEQKDVIHDSRISTIEEQLRKSTSGENTATKSGTENISLGSDVANAPVNVLVEGGLLDSENMFNLTTGTLNGITYTISGNQITLSGTASAETTLTLASGLTAGNKAYVNLDYRSGTSTGVITLKNGATSLNATYNADYSGVVTLEGTTITLVIANGAVLTNVIYKANINKVTVLISNKQYSPIYDTTFDLMSDAQIKIQMDTWVLDGTLPNDIMAVSMDKRIRSVGKNLFDKGLYATNYAYKIKVKPSTAYIWGVSTAYKTYDINMVEVSSGTATTLTTGSDTYYIAFSGIANVDTFQLELGSTATTYQPYISHDLYLQSGEVGYRLPNLVNDSMTIRNGKGYFTRRVQRYVLQASDVINILTTYTNLDYARINRTTLSGWLYSTITSPTTSLARISFLPIGYTIKTLTDYDNIVYINTFDGGADFTYIWVGLPKGTSLAQAQTTLAGTVIYYQLATPVEEEILTIGNAQVGPNSSIYIDDMKWIPTVYTTNITVTTAISELISITKMNVDGSETQLAVSGATVAGDGLSFTHSGLTSGDAVRFTYIPQGDYFKGNTDVIYYDNPLIVTDSVTSTVYKIIFTVANGVITVDKVVA